MIDGPHLALAGDAVHFRVVAPSHHCTFTIQINDKKICVCHASGLPDLFFVFCSYLLFIIPLAFFSSFTSRSVEFTYLGN
jgi:hypothetical protein